MRKSNPAWSVLVLIAGVVGSASAQFQMQAPKVTGVWNPLVGAGAAYVMEEKRGKHEMEMAIVDKETVEGKTGYWLEMMLKDPREGEMVMKYLYVLDGNQISIKRLIFQPPRQQPLEMPMAAARGSQTTADFRKESNVELVGQESVTTPAGTFACQHYRAKNSPGDYWVSEKVSPWGLVKMTSQDTNMTLLRVISGAKSRITGTPQKFNPMDIMRRQQP